MGVSDREDGGAGGLTRGARGGGLEDSGSREGDGGDVEGEGGKGEEPEARGLGGVSREPFILRNVCDSVQSNRFNMQRQEVRKASSSSTAWTHKPAANRSAAARCCSHPPLLQQSQLLQPAAAPDLTTPARLHLLTDAQRAEAASCRIQRRGQQETLHTVAVSRVSRQSGRRQSG